MLTPACVLIDRMSSRASTPQVLTSTDGRFQLTVPGDWLKETELNERADLQAANRVRETYAAVISESKQDFTEEMTLERFTSVTRNAILAGVHSAQSAEPTPTSINGNPALQYEIRGAVEGVNIVYIITTVETSEHYHQILTWTLPSRFDQYRDTLLDVTRSFKEVGAVKPKSDASPPPPALPRSGSGVPKQ